MSDRRNEVAWAVQSLMAKFIPDDYEDVWPAKFSFAMADALINGHPVLDKALAALPPPTVAVGEVRVKALEWGKETGLGFFHANVPFGHYSIMPDMRYRGDARVVWGFANKFDNEALNADDAKAAAQADYESRIRSALVPPPPQGEPGTEAVRRAVEQLTAIDKGLTDLVAGHTPWLDQSDGRSLRARIFAVQDSLRAALSAQPTAGWREGVEAAAKIADGIREEFRETALGFMAKGWTEYATEYRYKLVAAERIAAAIRNLTPPPPANAGGKL